MLVRILLAIGLVLVFGTAGRAAQRSDTEKDINRYEKIAKKVFCVCRASAQEGEAGSLTFFKSGEFVKMNCRLPRYDGGGSNIGTALCADDDYDIVGR